MIRRLMKVNYVSYIPRLLPIYFSMYDKLCTFCFRKFLSTSSSESAFNLSGYEWILVFTQLYKKSVVFTLTDYKWLLYSKLFVFGYDFNLVSY